MSHVRMLSISGTDDFIWLSEALRVIRDGGVVALAYERLFGLAADALNLDAVAKVAAIKSREKRASSARPISIILPHLECLSSVAIQVSPLAQRLANRFWPGPLTLVMPAQRTLPMPLVSERGLIGVRLAGPSPAALLAAHAGVPLTATSANRMGECEALRHEDIVNMDGVDLLLKGVVLGPPGSTVVDATGTQPRILRQGIIRIEDIS